MSVPIQAKLTDAARRLHGLGPHVGVVMSNWTFDVGAGGFSLLDYMQPLDVAGNETALTEALVTGAVAVPLPASPQAIAWQCVLPEPLPGVLLGELLIKGTVTQADDPALLGEYVFAYANFAGLPAPVGGSVTLTIVAQLG